MIPTIQNNLKKRGIILSSIVISTILIVSISCSKREISNSSTAAWLAQETNVRLVPDSVALKVAENFDPSIYFNKQSNNAVASVRTSSTNLTSINTTSGVNKIKNKVTILDSAGIPAFYIYNFVNKNGYVCISADSGMIPVLAYIEMGEYTKNDGSSLDRKWLLKTIFNIGLVRRKLHDNKKLAEIAWKNNFSNIAKNATHSTLQAKYQINSAPPPPPPSDPCSANPDYYSSTTTNVGPLLNTQWGIYDTYNNSIGYGTCGDNYNLKPSIGYASTAMAQIMKYYNQPTFAYGHTYNYSGMASYPGNSYSQTLIYDASISLNVSYDCGTISNPSPDEGYTFAANHSNSLFNQRIANSFKNNFGYDNSDYGGYTISSDFATIVSQIYSAKPVILFGYSDSNTFLNIPANGAATHFWICDGLSQTNVTFCYNGS